MIEEKKEYKKCSKETGFCKTLASKVQPTGNYKGFSVYQTLDIEQETIKVIGVVYKENSKDRGLMLNTCPWCSESIKWWKS